MFSNKLLGPNIVARLRLVFAYISVVLCLALAVGLFQVRKLDQSVEELTGPSIAVFFRSEAIEKHKGDLLLLLQNIDAVGDLDNLAELEARVARNLATLRLITDQVAETRSSAQIAAEMSATLDLIEQGTAAILAAKGASLVKQQRQAALIKELNAARLVAREILEDMSYAKSELTFPSDDSLSDGWKDQIVQSHTRNLMNANSITSITLELEAVVDRAISLGSVADPMVLATIEQTLRYKMRSIIGLLGQITQTARRTELSNEIFQIRGRIISDRGLVATVRQLQADEANLKALLIAQRAPIRTISQLSGDLTRLARQQVNNAGVELQQTSGMMLIVLASAALSCLIAIGACLTLVVERQINQRMAKLTDAVLAIADGNKEYKVEVSGPDELGRMASALEVFKENATELQRSNLELEKFAYIAAHDLRSPLRAIKDLTEWMSDDEDSVLSEESTQYIQLITRRVDRLSQLLTDLLEYSRAGNETNSLAEVSVAQIVAESDDLLNPGKAFDIRYEGLDIETITLATPLRQILLNLINNAIKHHDRATGEILVKAWQLDGRVFCSVQDDGPGIPPKHHDRIFGLFQTLKSRDEVEGSGLGLAIIHKLVSRYAGSIHVRSDPETQRGTKFTFDLPQHDQIQDDEIQDIVQRAA